MIPDAPNAPAAANTPAAADQRAGTLTPMPDELTEERAEESGESGVERVFSGYGVGSAVLGLIAVAAVVLSVLIWSAHRGEVDERRYQTRVLQAAADWTSVLINMNKDTVDADMVTLHDGTVGQLNTDFETVVQPFRQIVQTLQSHTTGQVDSVAIESVYHNPQAPEGAPALPQPPRPELEGLAARTDTVLAVATSVSENAGGKEPQTVRWNLRLDVSDIDGRLLISRLEPIR